MKQWLRDRLCRESPQPPHLAEHSTETKLPDHYFDIYNLAVEMADRVSARRALANSFFATVQTALIALLGSKEFPWYVAVAGIVLSVVWWGMLKSYRDLNRAKFDVINEMEKRLPAKIFTEEWVSLKGEKGSQDAIPSVISKKGIRGWLSQYRELGAVERSVPWMFAVIYLTNLGSRVNNWPDVPEFLKVWQ